MKLTETDLCEFCDALRERLANPELGDIAAPHEVSGLHSDDIAEDGKRIRLYDLAGGRTGAQIDDGVIRYCD
ncbi:hypothetical protein [Polaromonas sp. JS666]|uniref:hypothetical protein n=1 Tax=Polaromonas sp. (strain JS666 / ATCC BAA-500) TaxID=296591 RepID=UPI0000463F14|nr:hypothetical protein [Polaromonas sp. JS666]